MTNTETIKTALIKQIIDSGSTLPLSVLVGNIDLLINAAANDKFSAISENVIGSHITEPELKVEYLKAGEWYVYEDADFDTWLIKFSHCDNKIIYSINDICLELLGCKTENEIATHHINEILSIRHATREEIIKYFPHEFEVDTHGGNDIPQLTDPQL